jgi:hypothetical protein
VAGAQPDLSSELSLDVDATIVQAHSDKELAAPTWKRTYGFYPLACFLDRPEVSSGEALAAMLRPGNAGSNTATDHEVVLAPAIAYRRAAHEPWISHATRAATRSR